MFCGALGSWRGTVIWQVNLAWGSTQAGAAAWALVEFSQTY